MPNMAWICQVARPDLKLPCGWRESGGYQCEVLGEHDAHKIGEHTINHSLAGNGYPCAAIDPSMDDCIDCGHTMHRSNCCSHIIHQYQDRDGEWMQYCQCQRNFNQPEAWELFTGEGDG